MCIINSMFKLLAFFLLFLFVFVTQISAQNLKNKDGKRTGKWIFYKSGSSKNLKVEEGVFVNGRKEGQWLKYHKDGKTIKLRGSYLNNRPDGDFIRYYENGGIKEKGSFSKENFKGQLIRYHSNGKIAYIGNYNNSGDETGLIQIFHKNGNLELEYTVKNKILTGNLKRYFENGNLQSTITFSSSGKITSTKTYAKKEVVVKTSNPVDKSDALPYLKNPKTKGIKFVSFGYNKVYNENDEIWMDGNFKNGKLWDGKIYKYDRDGILQRVLVFKSGKYHSDGQL